MASFAKHGTLTANSVATVTLPGDGDTVEVMNRSGDAEIWYTTSGSAPTVGGDDCFVVPASITSYVAYVPEGVPVQVKLLSTGAEKYSVIKGQAV